MAAAVAVTHAAAVEDATACAVGEGVGCDCCRAPVTPAESLGRSSCGCGGAGEAASVAAAARSPMQTCGPLTSPLPLRAQWADDGARAQPALHRLCRAPAHLGQVPSRLERRPPWLARLIEARELLAPQQLGSVVAYVWPGFVDVGAYSSQGLSWRFGSSVLDRSCAQYTCGSLAL